MAQRGGVVVGSDGAADGGGHAQHVEIRPGDQFARRAFGLPLEAHADRRVNAAEDSTEHLVSRLEVLVHRVGERVCATVIAVVVAVAVQQHKFARALHRQHAQHELIDEREDGRVGANAEGEGQDATPVNTGAFERLRKAKRMSDVRFMALP